MIEYFVAQIQTNSDIPLENLKGFFFFKSLNQHEFQEPVSNDKICFHLLHFISTDVKIGFVSFKLARFGRNQKREDEKPFILLNNFSQRNPG